MTSEIAISLEKEFSIRFHSRDGRLRNVFYLETFLYHSRESANFLRNVRNIFICKYLWHFSFLVKFPNPFILFNHEVYNDDNNFEKLVKTFDQF